VWTVACRFVLLTLLGIQTAGAQQLTSLFNAAFAKIHAGDFVQGCAEAQRVVREAPRHYASYNLLGICAVQRGDLLLAESYFRKSVALKPEFLEAHINLGVNLSQQGKYQAAILQLSEALRLDPNNVSALFRLGQAELAMGSKSESIKHLHRASLLAPERSDVALSLATAHFANSERQAGREILERFVEQGDTHTLLSASVAALKAGEQDLAKKGLEKAVNSNPAVPQEVFDLARQASGHADYTAARLLLESTEKYQAELPEWNALLGYADYKLGEAADASRYLRRAIELDPANADYYMKMGEMLVRYNSDDAAIELFKAGLARLPDSALLHFGLAVSYWAHERNPEAAAESLTTASKLDPDFQAALSLLCEVRYRQKKWSQLQDAAERAVKLKSSASLGYYYEALVLIEGPPAGNQQKRLDQAKYLLAHSLQLKPDFADAHVAMGKILMTKGNMTQSIAEFQRATKLSPDEPDGYYLLGTAYRKAGEKDKSAQALIKFKKLMADRPESYEVLFQEVK
jgi:tetratricopeptide (TPR) repeat protein